MIVTLMFAQAGYLAILYFGAWTRGDEGFVIARAARAIGPLDLSADGPRYAVALALFAAGLLASLALVRARAGRVLVAMRENAERSRMLGYDPFRYRLLALTVSGLYAGAAGAAYALLFGYVGATFASIQYSILPLLWVLLGGAGTVLGPLVGTALMFYLVDLASEVTDATCSSSASRSSRSSSSPRAASSAPCARGSRRGCRDPARGPRPHPRLRRPAAPSRASTSTSTPARSTR